MFLPRRPSAAHVSRVLATQRTAPLSYAEAGMTRSADSRGYPRNHHETVLGSGSDVYLRAVAAVRGWAMYDLPWTEIHPPGTPVAEGAVVATVVRHLGFWSINPCRVVYAEEEETPALRAFSFALGTLPLHSERGEERFRVEWNRASGEVRFEVLASAAARLWRAGLSGPYVHHLQGRFGRAALEAVRAATK
jgi:uncharacterized protein (UPF0548 family)